MVSGCDIPRYCCNPGRTVRTPQVKDPLACVLGVCIKFVKKRFPHPKKKLPVLFKKCVFFKGVGGAASGVMQLGALVILVNRRAFRDDAARLSPPQKKKQACCLPGMNVRAVTNVILQTIREDISYALFAEIVQMATATALTLDPPNRWLFVGAILDQM